MDPHRLSLLFNLEAIGSCGPTLLEATSQLFFFFCYVLLERRLVAKKIHAVGLNMRALKKLGLRLTNILSESLSPLLARFRGFSPSVWLSAVKHMIGLARLDRSCALGHKQMPCLQVKFWTFVLKLRVWKWQ